jgi:deoxyadenosine/deoxycytidine kinase
LVIHLQCPPEEELRRIRDRARSEEKTIEIAYLGALNRAVAGAIEEVRARMRIREINSAVLDFAHNPDTERQVISDILAAAGM